jgi:hypothetical protein
LFIGLSPGLSRTNKKPRKVLRILAKFSDFSNCIPMKNSKEKSAEILPASSTKKLF